MSDEEMLVLLENLTECAMYRSQVLEDIIEKRFVVSYEESSDLQKATERWNELLEKFRERLRQEKKADQ